MKKSEIKKIENLKHNVKNYTIRWQLTSLCNYYCDFCIQGNKKKHLEESKGESSSIRLDICDKIINFIEKELNNKYDSVSLYLIGGEVTILKDFSKILNKLSNIKFNGIINYYITTNLSLSKEELYNLTKIFKGKNYYKYARILNISANFYKEFTTEEEFMDKIKYIRNRFPRINRFTQNNLNNHNKIINFGINKLAKYNRNLNLNLGYPLVIDADYEKYLEFKKRNQRYISSINYIIIRNYHKSISKEMQKKLVRHNNKKIRVTTTANKELLFYNITDLSSNIAGGFKPKGFFCDSGVNSISIDSKGNVSRCVSCSGESLIGNIITDKIKPLKTGFSCPSNHCSCNYYHIITQNKKI